MTFDLGFPITLNVASTSIGGERCSPFRPWKQNYLRGCVLGTLNDCNGSFSAGQGHDACWSNTMQMTHQVECKQVAKSVQLPIQPVPECFSTRQHNHPELLQAVDVSLVTRINLLVGDIEVDLNEPLAS